MKQVADEILKLRDMGKTVFILTHDFEFILSCCDHIVRFEKGQVVEKFELNKDTGIRLRQLFKKELYISAQYIFHTEEIIESRSELDGFFLAATCNSS